MRRSLAVLLLVAGLGAVGAPSLATGAPPDAAARAGVPRVTGYALPDLGAADLAASAAGLTTLTVDGVTLRADGRSVRAPSPGTLRVARAARARGLRTELLVSNYSDRLGDFDPQRAARLLRSPAHVRRVARRLARLVAAGGWDGVNLDLESLRKADGAGVVRLARALQRRMPAARTVSVDVSARGSARAYRRAGYRLRGLGRAVDVVQLMAYDQHGPTWSGPGPIGALDWQRRSTRALLAQVPAARVDLGVGGYGYTWPARRSGRTGRTVTVAQARALVRRDGAAATWDAAAGEWHARLGDGTVLWWSDGRSWRLRQALAAELGLHGLALWRIGSADPVA